MFHCTHTITHKHTHREREKALSAPFPSCRVCAGLWEPCLLTPNLLINSEGSQLTKAWKPHMGPQHCCHVSLLSLSACRMCDREPIPQTRQTCTQIPSNNFFLPFTPIPHHTLAAPQAYFKCLFCWIISWCCGRCLAEAYVNARLDCGPSVCVSSLRGDEALQKVTSGPTNKRVCGFCFLGWSNMIRHDGVNTLAHPLRSWKTHLIATCEPVNRICLATVLTPYCSAYDLFH